MEACRCRALCWILGYMMSESHYLPLGAHCCTEETETETTLKIPVTPGCVSAAGEVCGEPACQFLPLPLLFGLFCDHSMLAHRSVPVLLSLFSLLSGMFFSAFLLEKAYASFTASFSIIPASSRKPSLTHFMNFSSYCPFII